MKPEIVQYARERYIEEHQRFDHIENKCVRIMAFTTIIITGLTGLLAFYSAGLFQPNSLLDYSILIVTVLSVFVLICSWGHALASINLGSVSFAPSKEKNFSYMKERTETEMLNHMVNCYITPLRTIRPKIDRKAKFLRFAYEELALAGFFLSLLLFLTFLREILK